MIKRASLAMDIVHMFLFLTLTAYFLECWFFSTDTYTAGPIPFLILGLYFAFSTYLAETVKKFWIYIAFELAAFAGVCFVGISLGFAFPFIATSILMIVIHCLQRIRGESLLASPVWQVIIYFGVTYFIAMYNGCGIFMSFAVYFSMAYIVLIILDMNNSGLVNFLNARNNVSSIPAGQIRRSNGLMLLILGVMIAVMFILSTLFMDNGPIYYLIGQIQRFLKYLGQFIQFTGEANVNDTTPVDVEDVDGTDGYVPSEHAAVSSFDERILYILAAIILAAGIIALLYAAFKFIMKLLKSASLDDDQVDKEIYAEDVVVSLKPGRRVREAASGTPDMQIRKRYKKEIRRKRKEHKLYGNVDENKTPSQLEEEAVYAYGPEQRTADYWGRLHALYEKARYSDSACTPEDAASVSKPVR